jgi:hypothetical protein
VQETNNASEKTKNNDSRRALNGLSAENKKARRLKLVWIRKLVVRCRKYMRETVGDMICDKDFVVGLRSRDTLLDKGDAEWQNKYVCIYSSALSYIF